MNSLVGKVTNRFVVGLAIVIMWGLATGVSAWIFSIPFTGNFADLYTGLSNITTFQGFVTTAYWLLSMIVLGFIGYYVVKNRRIFEPYKAERDMDDLPAKPTIVYLIVVAALLSFMFFLVNTVASVINQGLGATSLKSVYDGVLSGNLTVLVPFFIFTMIIGIIGVAIIGSGRAQKIADATGLNKT